MNWEDISKTYVITIPGSTRQEVTAYEMRQQNIPFEWWNGIKKENGEEGIRETLFQIFENCLKKGFNNVLIFEDDVHFLFSDAYYRIEKCLNDLPEDYDLCKFGANLLVPVDAYSDHLNVLNGSYALHAVLYSRKCMEEILKHRDKTYYAIDIVICNEIEMKREYSYVSKEMIATQRTTVSSIFKYNSEKHNNQIVNEIYNQETGEINWHSFMVNQWERNTKHLK